MDFLVLFLEQERNSIIFESLIVLLAINFSVYNTWEKYKRVLIISNVLGFYYSICFDDISLISCITYYIFHYFYTFLLFTVLKLFCSSLGFPSVET